MGSKKQRLVMRTVILILLLVGIGFALYSNFAQDDRENLKLGSTAPDFVLTDMEGTTHQLSDYKGQGVFLNFWGTWCKPCEYEMPFMENQYNKYKDQGVQILAVNVGESDYAVNAFIKKHGLTFPVLIDKGEEVGRAYLINPLPVTFLIDKEGVVIDRITGALTEESIQQHMERIKP